jgi:hypothetical protein
MTLGIRSPLTARLSVGNDREAGHTGCYSEKSISLAMGTAHQYQRKRGVESRRPNSCDLTCCGDRRMRSGRQSERGFVLLFAGSRPRMLTRLLFAFAALALFRDFAFPQSQDIPPALAPQQGAILSGRFAAKGVQIYVCRVKEATNEWAFKAPEATLVDAEGRPFAKHYAGPTWEAPDGSKASARSWLTSPRRRRAQFPGCSCLRNPRHRAHLPACVSSSASTPPAESRRPARVRQSAQSSVSITRPITSFTSNP